MYCSNCGFVLNKDKNYCERCGKKIDEYSREKGPWKGFAKAGSIISIVCIVLSFIPFYGIAPLPFGFIFSGMGLYSKVENERAKRGMKNCIIASIIQTVVFFIFILILCLMPIIFE